MSNRPPSLEYAPAIPARRGRNWWWLIPLVLVSAAVVTWQVRGLLAGYMAQRRLVRLVAIVKTDSPGKDVVAYEDDVTRAAVIGRSNGYITINGWDSQPRVGRVPPAWFDLRYASRNGWQIAPDDAVLFVHSRKTVLGAERVVMVHAKPSWPDGKTVVDIYGMTLIIGPQTGNLMRVTSDTFDNLALVDSDKPAGNGLRIFAGQADPNDASHFTIAYEIDGMKGTLDGWLKENPDRDRSGTRASDGIEVLIEKRGTER